MATRPDHTAYMRARRAALRYECRRCGKAEQLPGRRSCARCLARDLERHCPGFEHDTEAHARELFRCVHPDDACDTTGLTLIELARGEMTLQVDRIDPERGYVAGNMQVIASLLNRLKARERSWPEWAAHEVHERCTELSDEARVYAETWTTGGGQ